MYFAKLSKDNICTSVSKKCPEFEKEGYIKLNTYDTSVLDKKYVEGKWLEVENLKVTLPLFSSFQIATMDAVAEMKEELAINALSNMEVQAEIYEMLNKGE